MNFLSKLFKTDKSKAEFDKREFLEWLTALAAARQVEPLDQAALKLYYERLQCFTREEMLEAVDALMDEPYRNFPTVGSFIEVIAEGSGKKAREFGSRRRREWIQGGTQEQRQIAGQERRKAERAAIAAEHQIETAAEEKRPPYSPDALLMKMEQGRLRHEINTDEQEIADAKQIDARERKRQKLKAQAERLRGARV